MIEKQSDSEVVHCHRLVMGGHPENHQITGEHTRTPAVHRMERGNSSSEVR